MSDRLKQLADSVNGCDLPDGDRDYLVALLRAASAETVGTEWGIDGIAVDALYVLYAKDHNADLHSARVAIADLKAERDEATKMAYMILPGDERNPGVTWREAYEILDEKALGEKHGHACAMSALAEQHNAALASLAEKQRAIDEAGVAFREIAILWQDSLPSAEGDTFNWRARSERQSQLARIFREKLERGHPLFPIDATKATEANSSATVTGSTQCDAASKLAAIESAIRFRSDATAKAVGDIIGNHSEPPKGSTPRQWTSTPPKDRSGKWWHKLRNRSGSYGLWLVPGDATWGESLREKGTDYDLWLPWQEGDTIDDLPPLPNQSTPASSVESGDIRYRVWECRVIVPADAPLPDGFDAPPRRAVIDAITSRGIDILRCASGWGHTPTDGELGVLDEEIHYPCQPATPVTTPNSVAHEFASVINRHSLEAGSNTPDWIVGEFLETCRSALDEAIRSRDGYYGVSHTPATTPTAAVATPAADACELVARLAEIMRCGFLWTEHRERDLASIIAAARRGGGA